YKLGRILGGSSSINGLVWVRGNRLDFDEWAASGCDGWSYEDVAPVFRRIEDYEDSSDPTMGHSGPIPVVRGCPETQPLNNAFISAAREAGYAVNPNYNSGTQEGFCALQRNTRNGKRGDVYQGYLKPALKRPNLTIVTGARAERLVIQSGVARGVEYRLGKRLKRVDAVCEILLTTGSLASPQLLELSGIGD
ncbi:MAG: choline dehydrogenase, partial [bacterium]|nr:choline dehydrogenase [bacterium]